MKSSLPIVGTFRHVGSCFQLFAEEQPRMRSQYFLDVRLPRRPYLIINADPASETLTINYNDPVTVLPARWEDGCTFVIRELTFGVLIDDEFIPMMLIDNKVIDLKSWIDELNRRISECRRVRLPREHSH